MFLRSGPVSGARPFPAAATSDGWLAFVPDYDGGLPAKGWIALTQPPVHFPVSPTPTRRKARVLLAAPGVGPLPWLLVPQGSLA